MHQKNKHKFPFILFFVPSFKNNNLMQKYVNKSNFQKPTYMYNNFITGRPRGLIILFRKELIFSKFCTKHCLRIYFYSHSVDLRFSSYTDYIVNNFRVVNNIS